MYDTLAFALTKQCTAQCEICCFSSSPHDKQVLNLERVQEYIIQSRNIPAIKTIAFTGGEPFLLYDDLLNLVHMAKESYKKVNAITNGFWANSYQIALEKLQALKLQGLDFLSVSFDAYHEKYVGVNNIRNLLQATTYLNIPTAISIVCLKDEKVGSWIDALGDKVYTSDIKIAPCLPSGRASKNFLDSSFARTIDVRTCKCEYGGNLVVLYDGKIYPCCSQEIVEMQLSIGDFEDISLAEALNLLKNNALLYFLRNTDFLFYVDYARSSLHMDIPDKVVSPCELCRILFANNRVDEYYDYVETAIKALINNGKKNE